VRQRLRAITLARTVVALVSPLGARLGSLLLRTAGGRKVMNAAAERLGPLGGDAFISLFAQARPTGAFLWTCRFGRSRFVLPVAPHLPRSWEAAWLWRWVGNAGVRRLYELCVARGAGVLLDVGANDGLHSYPFAAHGFECVCFEPQQSNREYIELTAKANGFAIDIVGSAVGERDADEVEFFLSDQSRMSSMVREHVASRENPRVVRVPCVTLDSYCSKQRITPSFVKIDVEEYEWPVLAGAEQMLHGSRPDLFVEVAPRPDRERIWTLLCEELDYRAFYVDGFDSQQPFRPISTSDAFLQASAERSAHILFAGGELATAVAPWCK
jgi:FkbM family methyltransferase